MIEIKDISFSYPGEEEKVLSEINFSIKAGEFVALIGRNSSGKSTLARLIAGVYLSDTGHIEIDGIRQGPEEPDYNFRLKTGLVFQNPDNQIIGTTVEEDIAFGLENMGVPGDEMPARISAALAKVSLSGFEKKKPHELSGGQKQRLAIAAVLAMSTDVLIFDEATTLLDPDSAATVLSLVRELNESGHTVIYITHFMDEVLEADRLVVLDSGKIQRIDTPRRIFADVNFLRKLDLDLPYYSALAAGLKKEGVKIKLPIFSAEELGKQLKSQGARLKIKESELYPKPKNNETVIEASELFYSYNTVNQEKDTVLKGINLTISKNQFVGFVGASGAGKSTFAQLIDGLLPDQKGLIYFNGKKVSAIPPRELHSKIGMVFQFPEDQIFEDTVWEEMLYGLSNIGVPEEEAKRRIVQALLFVKLDPNKILAQSPFALSGGYQRRLAIASILAMEPEVLILDEPTAGLDPYMRRELLLQLYNLHCHRGHTTIVISHHIDDIFPFVNHYIAFESGEVVFSGAPADLFSNADLLKRTGLSLPRQVEFIRSFERQI